MEEVLTKEYGPVICYLYQNDDGSFVIETECGPCAAAEATPVPAPCDREEAIQYAESHFPWRALAMIKGHRPRDGWGVWTSRLPAIITELECEIAWAEHDAIHAAVGQRV